MIFSPKQAMKFALDIAQPRRAGSEGERFATENITGTLEGFGYHVEQQPFQFIAALHGWIRLELVLGSLLILALMTLRTISPWASLVPTSLLLLLIFLVNRLHRWVQASSLIQGDHSTLPPSVRLLSWLGPKIKANNIVAFTPDNVNKDNAPHLYLMAHYDSKSQTLPLPIRMALFALTILGGFSATIVMILSILLPELDPLIPYFGWGSLLFGIPLIYMGIGNDSPGAIDNASGVGLILHLAELLATEEDLLHRLRVTFLFTAAEEEGLMGAQAYVAKNEPALRRQAQKGGFYILNFDGVGTRGRLLLDEISQKRRSARRISLGDWVRDICSELNIPIGRFPPIGALMDHAPFAHCGFNAISLATSGQAVWSVHTRGDTAEKLHPKGFKQAGRVALKLIEKMAYNGNSLEPEDKWISHDTKDSD
jgi:hypothetical protein